MDQEQPPIAGRYRLLELRGRGGMADVYHAVDDRLGRDVAVKVLLPAYARDPQFVERFRREAQSAAALNHPNVVAVYDWGEEADSYFMVMEYVAGPSLKEVLAERDRLPESEALSIARQAAAGLAAAHARGLVHRDVKPHNILLSSDGQTKVADFGIAYAAGATRFTAGNAVSGTAMYMSPEQVQTRGVDPRADVYSLGIVLYEMLTGSPPFTSGSIIEIAMQHATAEIPDVLSLRPDVSLRTAAVVRRALARNPDDRYVDALALERALAGAETPSLAKSVLAAEATTVVTVPDAAADRHTPTTGTGRVIAKPAVPARKPRMRAPLLVVPPLLLLGIAALVFALAPSHNRSGGRNALSGPTATAVATSRPVPAATRKPAATMAPVAVAPAPRHPPPPAPTATVTDTPMTTAGSTLAATADVAAAGTDGGASGPADTVQRFYTDVMSGDFAGATLLWSSAMQQRFPPATYIDQEFSNVTVSNPRTELVSESGDRAAVAVSLDEIRQGATIHLTGEWFLVRSAGRWLMDGESFCTQHC